MSTTIEVADGAAAQVYSTSVESTDLERVCFVVWGGADYDCAHHEHDIETGERVLVIDNGSSHQYIVTGNLEAFARKILEAVHA